MSKINIILLLVSCSILIGLSEGKKTLCKAVSNCLSKPRPCSTLPAPYTVPLDGPKLYQMFNIRDSVWIFFSGGAGSLIVYKFGMLTIIDAPFGTASFYPDGRAVQAIAIKDEILKNSKPRRVNLVYGHKHYDHIAAATGIRNYVKENYKNVKILVYGSKETRASLTRPTRKKDMPSITNIVPVHGKRTIKYSKFLEVQLTIAGGHTKEDLLAFIPRSKEGKGIIHNADFVTPGFPTWIDFGTTPNLFQYMETLKLMLNMEWDILSGGHSLPGSKADVRITLQYTEDTLRFAKVGLRKTLANKAALGAAGIFNVSTPGTFLFSNNNYLSVALFDLASVPCTRNLIRKYGCKLTSVAVTAPSHCQTALIYNEIETLA